MDAIRVYVLKYRICVREKKRSEEEEERKEEGRREEERRRRGGSEEEEGRKRGEEKGFPCSLAFPAFFLFLAPPTTITELHSRTVQSIQTNV